MLYEEIKPFVLEDDGDDFSEPEEEGAEPAEGSEDEDESDGDDDTDLSEE